MSDRQSEQEGEATRDDGTDDVNAMRDAFERRETRNREVVVCKCGRTCPRAELKNGLCPDCEAPLAERLAAERRAQEIPRPTDLHLETAREAYGLALEERGDAARRGDFNERLQVRAEVLRLEYERIRERYETELRRIAAKEQEESALRSRKLEDSNNSLANQQCWAAWAIVFFTAAQVLIAWSPWK